MATDYDLFGNIVADDLTRHLAVRKLPDPKNPRDPAPRRYEAAYSIDPDVKVGWSNLKTRQAIKRKWKAEAKRGANELHRRAATACGIDWMDLYKTYR
jgi:kynurenine formamidase